MSAIDITPAVEVTPAATTRLRLTVRGRRVLAALAAIPVVAVLGIVILGGGSALASRSGASHVSFQTVTVQTGDTLWGIAQEVAPQSDPRDVVDAIVRLNALNAVTLTPGQRIAIPAEYGGK